jgi:hypothetical protein
MSNTLFVRAEELGVSKPYTCKLVRKLNKELDQKGFLTISERVSMEYYREKDLQRRSETGERSTV